MRHPRYSKLEKTSRLAYEKVTYKLFKMQVQVGQNSLNIKPIFHKFHHALGWVYMVSQMSLQEMCFTGLSDFFFSPNPAKPVGECIIYHFPQVYIIIYHIGLSFIGFFLFLFYIKQHLFLQATKSTIQNLLCQAYICT